MKEKVTARNLWRGIYPILFFQGTAIVIQNILMITLSVMSANSKYTGISQYSDRVNKINLHAMEITLLTDIICIIIMAYFMYSDIVKDKLKGMATLGAVRFTTVQTPKYLVLSGKNLHLFDTDTDGEIDRHFIFDAARLENSRLTKLPLTGSVQAQAQARGNNIKAYKLSLQTDDKPVELIIYSCLIFTNIAEIPTNPQETIEAIIIANDFLKQLGDLYPNLKVSLPIFN